MTSTALQIRQDTNANIVASTGLVQGEIAFDVTRTALILGSSGGAGGIHWVTPFVGSWTPTIFGASSAGSQTYAIQTGTYIKVGRLVIAQCRMQLTNNSGSSGNATIGGLPFAPSTAANSYFAGAVGFISNVAHSTALTNPQFSAVVNLTTAKQALLLENSTGTFANVAITQVSTNADVCLTFTYEAANDTT